MYFLDNVLPEDVAEQIDRGMMIGAGRGEDSAEVRTEYSGRPMALVVVSPTTSSSAASPTRSAPAPLQPHSSPTRPEPEIQMTLTPENCLQASHE